MHGSAPLQPGESDPALAAHLSNRDIRCKKCKYNLRGLTTNACPECGTTYMLAGGTLFSEAGLESPLDANRNACPRCGYDRTGLPGAICPECGYDPAAPPRSEPPPSTEPLSTITEVWISAWPRFARDVLHWLAIIGHLIGWLAAMTGMPGWLGVTDEIAAATSAVGVVRVILRHVARTIVPIVAFAVALIHNRHQPPRQRRRVANLAISLGLAWLWLMVLGVLWM